MKFNNHVSKITKDRNLDNTSPSFHVSLYDQFWSSVHNIVKRMLHVPYCPEVGALGYGSTHDCVEYGI